MTRWYSGRVHPHSNGWKLKPRHVAPRPSCRIASRWRSSPSVCLARSGVIAAPSITRISIIEAGGRILRTHTCFSLLRSRAVRFRFRTFRETPDLYADDHDLGLFTTAHWVEPERLHRPRVKHARLEGDLYSLLFQKNFITTSAVLVKRGCFETIGGFNEKLEQAEDYDMWLRIARRYPMVFLNQPLCRWRSHSSNVSRHELQRRVCVQRVIQANYDPARISQKIWKLRQSRVFC